MSVQDWRTHSHSPDGSESPNRRSEPVLSDDPVDAWESSLEDRNSITKGQKLQIGSDQLMHSESSTEDEYTLLDFASEFEGSESGLSAEEHRDAINQAEEIQEEKIQDLFGDR